MSSRTSNHTALYLRSSKDRSDVSIDAQRRELTALATQRGLLVVREYSDVVESGTDENRPGLRALVADIRKSGRGWDTVMLLDTSRLAGMAENVRQGFRAGGRAPRGYRLATIETGAIREGAAVTKTKLEPNDDAS